MRKTGLTILMLAAVMLGALGPTLATPAIVHAADDSTEALRPDSIKVSCKYPSSTGPADTTFMYSIELMYQLTDLDPMMGDYDTGRLQSRTFNFDISAPPGWEVFVAESSWKLTSRIKAMSLRALGVPTSMVVVATAPWWENIEPGEYPIELNVTAADGGTSDSLALKAVVTAWYGIDATTSDGRLNAKTSAGAPAIVNLMVTNTGSAALDNVSVSSTTPSGIANEQWVVRFEPESITNLAPGEERELKVSVTPPEKAISGDYYLTLSLDSEPAPSNINPSLELRVSIATRPMWVLVGIAIVVLAFAALMYAFYILRQR